MNKNVKSKKYVSTIFTVLLLLVTVLIPGINGSVIRAEPNNEELFEINTELYFKETIISYRKEITKQELRELNIFIENIKEKFDNANNIDEAFEINRDAVCSLNNYNLLPKELSVKEIQNLIIDEPCNELQKIRDVEKKLPYTEKSEGAINNLLCAVLGRTNTTSFYSMFSIMLIVVTFGILFKFQEKWLDLIEELNYGPIITGLLILILASMSIPFLYILFWINVGFQLQPFSLLNVVEFGQSSEFAFGWIHTMGILGAQSIAGEFFGRVSGFTGIKISIPNEDGSHSFPGDFFYLGFAIGASVQHS